MQAISAVYSIFSFISILFLPKNFNRNKINTLNLIKWDKMKKVAISQGEHKGAYRINKYRRIIMYIYISNSL